MALTNKLTAIADAIRAKTGKTNPMTLDEMPTEISGITTGTSDETVFALNPMEYPPYVRKEITRVADNVRNVLTDKSIVSICLSDSHYPADENTRKSALHALMAIKGLTYLIPVDFIAHLGDVGFEGVTGSEEKNTNDYLEENIVELLGYVKDATSTAIPKISIDSVCEISMQTQINIG